MDIDWKKQLVDRTEMNTTEVKIAIQEMMDEYDGLVGEEAAAILVAREKGLDLVQELGEEDVSLDIENIVPEMRKLYIEGYIDEVEDEYNPDGKDYRVTSVIIKDETGKTQVSFWNEHSDKAQKLRSGLKIEVEKGYTQSEEKISDYQMDRYGVPGIQLGDKAKVIVSNDEGQEKVLISPDEEN